MACIILILGPRADLVLHDPFASCICNVYLCASEFVATELVSPWGISMDAGCAGCGGAERST